MAYGRAAAKPIYFHKFEHGLNSSLNPTEVAALTKARYPRYHAVDCLNAMLDVNKRRPCVERVGSTLTGRLYGMAFYPQMDGTENLLYVLGQKLYSMVVATGVSTELYDFGGTGRASFKVYFDKAWVTNGIKVVKVENVTAYQVGIAAPGTVTAQAKAGGSLADGVYKLFACYARSVGGAIKLRSKGYEIGTIDLSDAGDDTVEVTSFPNSSDPQVNNKLIYMTDAGGSTYYKYHETGDNTTTIFDITSNANRDADDLYSVNAQYNDVPPALEGLTVHDGRVIGFIDNVGYYSARAGDVYELERFRHTFALSNYKYEYPHKITGVFGLGPHVYFNTENGLIRQPYCDFNAQPEPIGADQVNPSYFKYFGSVAAHGNKVFGITPKKIGIFDGEKWYENDFSRDVKVEFKTMLDDSDSNNEPAGAIFQGANRVEYRIGYLDTDHGNNVNNRNMVLNIDELKVYDREDFIAPWEKWSVGANFYAVKSSGEIYGGQTDGTNAIIFRDRTDTVIKDENVFVGDSITTLVPQWLAKTGTFMPDDEGIYCLQQIRTLANFSNTFKVLVQFVDRVTTMTRHDIVARRSFRLSVSRLGVSRMITNAVEPYVRKVNGGTEGYAFYIEITQDNEDQYFNLQKGHLKGYIRRDRTT